jgi:DMSO/TMAO reductase YedYZ molybdopterin-dependent catalytic subunit
MLVSSPEIPRRRWLKSSLLAGATLLAGFDRLNAWPIAPGTMDQDPLRGAQHLGDLDFLHEPRLPMESALGAGLDGRLYTNLAALSPGQSSIPTAKFYIRTRASELLPDLNSWQIKLASSASPGRVLPIPDLQKQSRSMGVHLMECSGNGRETRFGLLSVADWAGVPIGEVLDRLPRISSASARVLISGFDHYPGKSVNSIEGASWVFTADQLQASGAFLALQMNGDDLTRDHGAPVRLVMPRWYGCTSIKWVNEISVVPGDAPATSQMQEFASRTHQDGIPKLARDFRPAKIPQAAMPIRVEKWSAAGNITYRVVGILWGGSEPVKALQIRFNPEEDYVPVENFASTTNDPWSFWWHTWTPKSPGTYAIRLRVMQPTIPAKRLDTGFFVRSVEITEV